MITRTLALRSLVLPAFLIGCGGAVAPGTGDPAPAATPSSKPPAAGGPGTGSSGAPGTTPTPGPTVNTGACPETLPPVDPDVCTSPTAACHGSEAVAVGTVSRIDAFAVGDTYVYWKTGYSDLAPGCSDTIYRTPRSGGVSDLVKVASNVTGLATAGEQLYWVETLKDQGWKASVHTVDESGAVVLGGTAAAATTIDLFQTGGGVLAVDSSQIFLAGPHVLQPLDLRPIDMGASLAWDGTNVFTTTANDHALVRVEGDGVGAVASGATTEGRTIAVDDNDVYYASGWPPSMGISRVGKSPPSAPEVLVPAGSELIREVLLAGPYLFFTVGNEIRQVLLATKEVSVFATLGAPPLGLANDGRHLLFRLEVYPQKGEITGPGGIIASREWLPL